MKPEVLKILEMNAAIVRMNEELLNSMKPPFVSMSLDEFIRNDEGMKPL
jgi:hypothetical protein